MVVGVALVAIAVGALAWFGRGSEKSPPPPDPYIASLKLSDLKMHAAENFVGGTVTYLEGRIGNAGNRTITRATAEVVFRNSLGEVVQKEELPVRVLQWQGPKRDIVNLRVAPLKPGETADFRLTFEHISSDWNQGYPAVSITSVTTQ